MFELGCTGQIYFPYLTSLARQSSSFKNIGFLLIYNLGFIFPLITVFILSYFGLTSDKLGKYFKQNLGKVKIGTALFFIGLAVLTVVIK